MAKTWSTEQLMQEHQVRRIPIVDGEGRCIGIVSQADLRSEEHTSELQSRSDLVCRLLLEKKKKNRYNPDRVEATTLQTHNRTGSVYHTALLDTLIPDTKIIRALVDQVHLLDRNRDFQQP